MRPMGGWLSALGLCVGLCAGASVARADCRLTGLTVPPMPPPTIRMNVIEPHVQYHHELDLLGLGKVRTREMAQKGVLLGLTRYYEPVRLQVRSHVYGRKSGGEVCASPAEIIMDIGHPVEDVYVANNYPPGSCEYQAVLAHENTHVSINQQVFREVAPRLRQALDEAGREGFPMHFASQKDAERVVQVVQQRIAPVLQHLENRLKQENAKIDTPERYRRDQSVCKNWFPKGTRLPGGVVMK